MAQPPIDDRASPAYAALKGRGFKYRVAVAGLDPEIYADPRPLHELRIEGAKGRIFFGGVVVDITTPQGNYRALVGKGDVVTAQQGPTGREEILLSLRYDDGFEESQSYTRADDDEDDDENDRQDGGDAPPTDSPPTGPSPSMLPPLGRNR